MVFADHGLDQSHQVGILQQLVRVTLLHVETHVLSEVLLYRYQVLHVNVIQMNLLGICAEEGLADVLVAFDGLVFEAERKLLLERAAYYYLE